MRPGEPEVGRQWGSWKVKPRSSLVQRAGTQTYGGRPGGVVHSPGTQAHRPLAHCQWPSIQTDAGEGGEPRGSASRAGGGPDVSIRSPGIGDRTPSVAGAARRSRSGRTGRSTRTSSLLGLAA